MPDHRFRPTTQSEVWNFSGLPPTPGLVISPPGRARFEGPGCACATSALRRRLFSSQDKSHLFQELLGSHLACLAESKPLDQVDPSLAPQNVAHRRLAHLHFPGEFLLGQPRIRANAGHDFQYGFLIGGVNRLCHRGKLSNPAGYLKSWYFTAIKAQKRAPRCCSHPVAEKAIGMNRHPTG